MKKGDRKAFDDVPNPEPGEKAKRPKAGRVPRFDYLNVDGLARIMGGRAKFMNIARLSTDEHVKSVIARWDVRKKSERFSLVDCLTELNLEASWFVSKVVEVAYANGVEVTKLIAAVCQPAMMQKNVEMGLTDEGFKDRELFFKSA